MKSLQFKPQSKMKILSRSLLIAGLFFQQSFSSALDATIEAFEDKPGYVQPIATFMGSIHNSAWFSSAKVQKEYGYTFGVPFTFAFLQKEDQFYNRTEATNCNEAKSYGIPCPYDDPQTKSVPTIFGPKTQVTFEKVLVDQLNSNFSTVRESAEDGFMADYIVLPFLLPEFGFRHDYFEYKFRVLWAPLDGMLTDNNKLSIWNVGFGLLHDLGHYYKDKELPVDFAVGFNYTYWGFTFIPGKTYTGELKVSGHVSRLFAMVGKSFGNVELLAHMGYAFSNMGSSGALNHIEDNEEVKPQINVDGRNGFEIGVQFTAHLGWDFLTGFTYGAQPVATLNFLQYKSKEKQ